MDRLTSALLHARSGDEQALNAAVRAGQAEVTRFLRPLVHPNELDDVVQDTFVRAYRALPRFRGEACGRTWLLSIARCAAADATRRRIRERRRDRHAQTSAVDSPATEGAYALQALIDGLDPERQEAFVLTQLVGCSYAEAAEICGVKIGTIRSRVGRARDELLQQVRAARTA